MIAFIDLEASALGRDGHPTEVGVALTDGRDLHEVRSWLIRPHPDWMFADGGEWDPVAAEMTGITPGLLRHHGLDARHVVGDLDALLTRVQCVYSDAPEQDQSWLSTLYDAADASHTVRLHDVMEIDRLQRKMNLSRARQLWDHTIQAVDAAHALPRHRAGPDATRLALAFLSLERASIAQETVRRMCQER